MVLDSSTINCNRNTIHILEFDLGAVRIVNENYSFLFSNSLLFPGQHDVNDGILVISKIDTGNLSFISLDGFLVALHDLCVWIQFHFELYLIVDFLVLHVLLVYLIKDSLELFQLILG